jgi:hypothetical protein
MSRIVLTFAAAAAIAVATVHAQEKPKVQVQIPDPGVPQAMSIEANFVRAAYNNEGYAIIGYQVAQRSLGDEWMMIDLGTTVRSKTPDYDLKREHLSVDTPDGKHIPLATVEEYRKGDVRNIEQRAKVQRDSINYFPPEATQACRLGFFSEPNERVMPWDQVELSSRRGCAGRLFFNIPGGIKVGQYFLNVKFAQSTIRVPFRIFTEAEEKTMSKNFKDIRKQIDEAFRPPKKK